MRLEAATLRYLEKNTSLVNTRTLYSDLYIVDIQTYVIYLESNDGVKSRAAPSLSQRIVGFG